MAMAQLIYPEGANCERNIAPAVVRFAAGDHLAGAGAIVYAADPERGTVVSAIFVDKNGTGVKIADGATTVFEQEFTGPVQFYFNPPKVGTPNTAMTITLTGAGKMDVHAWREK